MPKEEIPGSRSVGGFPIPEGHALDFKGYERGPTTQPEMDELASRLSAKTDIDAYRGSLGKTYKPPIGASVGYTTIDVLPQVVGLPLSDLVLAYVHALRPSSIRVSGGEVKTNSCLWRVTVYVDKDDVVTGVRQEVSVLYSCGAEIGCCLSAAKGGDGPPKPPLNVYNIDAITRVDFE